MENSQDSLIGTRLANRYEIVSVVGKGGMGVVYRAYQEMMDRHMAIKMLHSHMVTNPEAMQRFLREAKTIAQVQHHHIVTLYDFGVTEVGLPYLVMDYLEGISLKHLVQTSEMLTFERANRIFKQVVDGLAAAHAHGVVHRDLKPENIMLTRQKDDVDWVVLVDFGLSKLKDIEGERAASITKVGNICGSPPYMSPEQCLSTGVVDPRSDIYSLAIVAYEVLTKKLPFSAKSAMEMFECHLYKEPIPFNQVHPELKVATEITNVLRKALEKEPENRYSTVQEFGAALQEALMRDAVKIKAINYRAQQPLLSFEELDALRPHHHTSLNILQVHNNPDLEKRDAELVKLADEKARKLRRIQEILKIVFAVLVVYAGYVGLNDPTVIKTIQKIALVCGFNR